MSVRERQKEKVSPLFNVPFRVFIFYVQQLLFWDHFSLDDDDMIGTRARSAKNRTSTLSPSQTSTSTRTISWCSSSSAVSATVSPTISIRSASSVAHQSAGVAKHRDLSLIGASRKSCFEARCQAGPCREKVKLKAHSGRDDPNRHSRRGRSLSTEEIETIGCFKLKSYKPQCNTKATGVLDKPAWLQICDPCHRILERSLTPDLSDTVRLRDLGESGRISKTSDNFDNTHHRYLDVADLNYIDSSSLCGCDLASSEHLVLNRRRILEGNIESKSVQTSEVPPTLFNGQWNKNHNKNHNVIVNNKLEVQYLCKTEDSLMKIIGADEIINNKVFRHGAQRSEEETEDHSYVANKNVDEEERVDIESKWLSRASDRRCFNPEVEQQATQLSLEQPRQGTNLKCDNDSHEQKKYCVTLSEEEGIGNDSVQSGCFETDYEKCIESINRQLNLESPDAGYRRTTAAAVSVSGTDPHSEEDKVIIVKDLSMMQCMICFIGGNFILKVAEWK